MPSQKTKDATVGQISYYCDEIERSALRKVLYLLHAVLSELWPPGLLEVDLRHQSIVYR